MTLFINACARKNSRTRRLAKALLAKRGKPFEEVCLYGIDFPLTDGEYLEKGHVYISKGGAHMKYEESRGRGRIVYTDEPAREGVKPCANDMYESLANSPFHSIVCVVLTGMGKDGTEGIKNLVKTKKTHIIAEDAKCCVVNGMPGSIVATGLVNEVADLDLIAQSILTKVGVR